VTPEAIDQRLKGSDWAKPITDHHRRPEVGGLGEPTERRLARGHLHVAAADWCASEAVT
jgi:hypothetical protein